MLVKGKRIIVTGGASGIGEATVKAYAREGAAVVSVDINDAAGTAIAADAAKLGPGPVTYLHLDITKADAVNSVFDEAVKLLGGLDVLANIAGIAGVQRQAEDFTAEDFDMHFAVHGKGTAFTNQAAFRHMRETGGSIINYSSAAGVTGIYRNAAYGAAKAAILGWTRNAASEWGRYLIRVNAVCPAVTTPMAEVWFAKMDPDLKAQIDAYFASKILLGGKLGKVEDAANVNLFLASDLSSFITGGVIGVDGGMTMPR